MTLDDYFNNISLLALEVYGGKRVLFVIGNANHDSVMSSLDVKDSFVVFDPDNCCLDYNGQRNFVTNIVLQSPHQRIVVVTKSPVILSDAFSCQILAMRGDGYTLVGYPTFGASPATIATHVLGAESAIGSLAERVQGRFMREAESMELPELSNICQQLGNGWPLAKLTEIYQKRIDSC